jgi:DNA-binding transcriptional MerR regulator
MNNSIKSGWTYKEVEQLTGITLGKLRHLDAIGLLKPVRIGSSERPTIRYTWEHLIALRAYAEMRKNCSLQALRDVLKYLNLENPIKYIANRQLVACNNVIYWTDDDDAVTARIVNKEHRNQFVLFIKGNELLERIWENGEGKIVDFEKRAKEKPCPRISA